MPFFGCFLGAGGTLNVTMDTAMEYPAHLRPLSNRHPPTKNCTNIRTMEYKREPWSGCANPTNRLPEARKPLRPLGFLIVGFAQLPEKARNII